ncbi:hemerythrin domain-containing protein [Dactylosporangium sp. McL0621]|uniref:hemerythrin domain-containing protein n=1 Tax=Dactylosporangium sp. McL0621 TaxID=3415678 RepID=UPI003CF39AD9
MTQVHQRDVVDVLLAQHSDIKALFNQVATAQGEQKRERFQELVRLLTIHESAEEQVVHPAARQALGDDGHRVVDTRLEEEREAMRALAELDDLGVGHPGFDDRLAALAADIFEHAAHEEAEEFTRLRATVGSEELQRMTAVFEAAENR